MSSVATATAAAALAISGKKATESIVSDLYSTAKGAIKKRFHEWKSKSKVDELYDKIVSVRLVKTIWQLDKEVDLLEFYHPSRLEYENRGTKVSTLADLPYDGHILIRGIVGQGKSIFLRYLASQTLVQGKKLPVFFELRHFTAKRSLQEEIQLRIRALGLSGDAETFEFLARSGYLVLMLDAMDEVPESLQQSLISEIELLCDTHDKLRCIVTSRPQGGLEASPKFRVLKLMGVREDYLSPLIHKLTGGSPLAQSLLDAISEAPAQVKKVLTTPLMVTLLVITYRAFQRIPQKMPEFYSQLFNILLARHDETKPGFVRERYSKLNDIELRDSFNALCFMSKRTATNSVPENEMRGIAGDATVRAVGKNAADAFLKDMSKATCLLLREGGQYHFIHKSIQEYHAASYVAALKQEAQAKRYYEKVLNHAWMLWREELEFLSEIDRYRFCRFFAIPAMERFAKRFLGRVPKSWNRTADSVVDRIGSLVGFRFDRRLVKVGETDEAGMILRPSLRYFTSVPGSSTHGARDWWFEVNFYNRGRGGALLHLFYESIQKYDESDFVAIQELRGPSREQRIVDVDLAQALEYGLVDIEKIRDAIGTLAHRTIEGISQARDYLAMEESASVLDID